MNCIVRAVFHSPHIHCENIVIIGSLICELTVFKCACKQRLEGLLGQICWKWGVNESRSCSRLIVIYQMKNAERRPGVKRVSLTNVSNCSFLSSSSFFRFEIAARRVHYCASMWVGSSATRLPHRQRSMPMWLRLQVRVSIHVATRMHGRVEGEW